MQNTNPVLFNHLSVGEVFKMDSRAYIKTSENLALLIGFDYIENVHFAAKVIRATSIKIDF